MDRPDYPAMVARLKPYLRTEQLHMRHVQFHTDTRLEAFDAPVSAIHFLTPRKDMDNVQEDTTITETLETWTKLMDSTANNDVYLPAVWGPAEEDVNETILIVGRKGVEVGRVDLWYFVCLTCFSCRSPARQALKRVHPRTPKPFQSSERWPIFRRSTSASSQDVHSCYSSLKPMPCVAV